VRRGIAVHLPSMHTAKYDLEDRLLDFSVRIIGVTDSMVRSRAASHIGDQLLRSGTSPYGHHGEAEAAESRDDFLHKLRICHKELRETKRWLRLVQRVPLIQEPGLLDDVIAESGELVRIFAASVRTALRNRTRPKHDGSP
jgi:four helix bundle protein